MSRKRHKFIGRPRAGYRLRRSRRLQRLWHQISAGVDSMTALQRALAVWERMANRIVREPDQG